MAACGPARLQGSRGEGRVRAAEDDLALLHGLGRRPAAQLQGLHRILMEISQAQLEFPGGTVGSVLKKNLSEISRC